VVASVDADFAGTTAAHRLELHVRRTRMLPGVPADSFAARL
jgi:hypothetical protein